MKKFISIDLLISVAGFFSIIFTLVFLVRLFQEFAINPDSIDWGITGQVGDFFGGVIGSLLTFITVLYLIKTNQDQKEQFREEMALLNFPQVQKRVEDLIVPIKETVLNQKIKITEIILPHQSLLTKMRSDELEGKEFDLKDLLLVVGTCRQLNHIFSKVNKLLQEIVEVKKVYHLRDYQINQLIEHVRNNQVVLDTFFQLNNVLIFSKVLSEERIKGFKTLLSKYFYQELIQNYEGIPEGSIRHIHDREVNERLLMIKFYIDHYKEYSDLKIKLKPYINF